MQAVRLTTDTSTDQLTCRSSQGMRSGLSWQMPLDLHSAVKLFSAGWSILS